MPFVAFEIEGTLFSYDSVIIKIEKTFAKRKEFKSTPGLAKNLFNYWYNEALRDYIATSQAGKYCALLRVLRATLPRALLCFNENFEIAATPDEIEKIMDAFRLLTVNPEANEAMKLLQDDELDWDMWGLTIGDFGEALHHLGKAKLGRYTGEHFVCCDELHVAKPHPKVYSELMRMAVHNKQKIENAYMVSSRAYELASAKNVAMRTVFLNTTEKVFPKDMYRTNYSPDITSHSLLDCVTKLIEFEKTKHIDQPFLTNDAPITIEDM